MYDGELRTYRLTANAKDTQQAYLYSLTSPHVAEHGTALGMHGKTLRWRNEEDSARRFRGNVQKVLVAPAYSHPVKGIAQYSNAIIPVRSYGNAKPLLRDHAAVVVCFT